MQKRSPAAVFFLSIITFGIYGIVWHVKTKNEMNAQGANIPTAWLLVIPFVSYYWLYKYSEGVEKVTGGKMSAVLSFVLLVLLGLIGMAILQNEFNKVADAPSDSFAGGAITPGYTPSQVAPVQANNPFVSAPTTSVNPTVAPTAEWTPPAAVEPTEPTTQPPQYPQ